MFVRALLTLSMILVSSVSEGASLSPTERYGLEDFERIPALFASPLADASNTPDDGERGRLRVAWPLPIEADSSDSGEWITLVDGSVLWRLRIASPGAAFVSVKLTDLHLGPGATLFVTSVDFEYRAGPFSRKDTSASGRFGTPVVPGDEVVLELHLTHPDASHTLRVESVSHGFIDAFGLAAVPIRQPDSESATDALQNETKAPGGPLGCQVDINCQEGSPFQAIKRAMAQGYDGSFVCSGGLVNNTAGDCRLLYLTAAHCEFWLDPDTLTFYWSYENSGCETGDAALANFTLGATDLYHDPATDLHLLEVNGSALNPEYVPYLAGWDRSAAAPTEGTILSFPAGKPMQVAATSGPILNCQSVDCLNGFGSEFWRVTAWDIGMTEQGSSGGALLDADDQVRGVLTGGAGKHCSKFQWDEFGQLQAGWEALAVHLDPADTGAQSIDGKDGAACGCECGPHGACDEGSSDCICDAAWAGPLCTWQCATVLGDLNASGTATISDVQCSIQSALAETAGTPPPACLSGPMASSDLDCDGLASVADVLLVVRAALSLPLLEAIDSDDNGCPDTCQL